MNTQIPAEDKIVGYVIYGFWGLLFLFGIVSLLNPAWLSKISDPGRISESNDYKNMADVFMREKNYGAAIQGYLKAIKVNPESYSAVGNLGNAYSKIGKDEKAISTYKYLIKKIPQQKNVAYINLGMLFEKKKDLENALKYYRLDTELDPFPFYAFNKTGVLYLKMRNWKNAAASFEQSIKIRTDMKNLYIGMLKREINLSKNARKKERLKYFMKEDVVAKQMKKYETSVFIKYLWKDKDLAKTYRNLAYAYRQIGDNEKAIASLRKALRILPSFSKARQELKMLEGTK